MVAVRRWRNSCQFVLGLTSWGGRSVMALLCSPGALHNLAMAHGLQPILLMRILVMLTKLQMCDLGQSLERVNLK
jgi:hypothetical protein